MDLGKDVWTSREHGNMSALQTPDFIRMQCHELIEVYSIAVGADGAEGVEDWGDRQWGCRKAGKQEAAIDFVQSLRCLCE